MPSRRAKGKARVFAAFIGVFMLVAVEVLSYVGCRVLQNHWLMYIVPRPKEPTRALSYAAYLGRRHPVLGWPSPEQLGTAVLDRTGARPSPVFAGTPPEQRAISLYGDSFTQSPNPDGVTWGSVLASLTGCAVSNYGQGGYGTDQAYLRYLLNVNDRASVVILAHLSEDILRNLTRNRDLLTGRLDFAYKPRFVLSTNHALELVALPALTETEHLRLLGPASPPLSLAHENFAPGGATGTVLPRFPFSWSLARNVRDYRVRAQLAGRPYYAEFYARNHPLRGLEITREILKAFAATARARHQVPLVLVLPTRQDVERFRKIGIWTYAPLMEELASAAVDAVEFGTPLARATAGRSLNDVYDKSKHFNIATDRTLAAYVAAQLRQRPVWKILQRRPGRP